MGSILSQEGNHTTKALAQCQKPILHPVTYYSATFTPTEQNYDIYKRELLAIIKALAHWRHYLGWTKTPFIICTNHANLQNWKSPRNLNCHTARWHADLQEYDYILEYIPGKTNTATDALSRPPGKDHGEEDNKDITIIPPHRAWAATTLAGQTVVPNVKEVRRAILQTNHDLPTAGHPGRDETLRKIQEHYWWPGIKDWVAEYVRGCAMCQQAKILTHKKQTPLYRIPTEENTPPFQVVAMDLITGLPMQRGLDAILTIVDHGCSRVAIFLPCSNHISGAGIAQLYLNHIYPWYGLPRKIISDRDPRFTSHFRKALTKRLGIQQNLSTASHPQTDGLSKQKNQWVEQYLRLVTGGQPQDWPDWLAVATTVHNNQKNSTTGLLPNQILLGIEPTLHLSEYHATNNEAVERRVKRMEEAWEQATRAINKKAAIAPLDQYKPGDQVWLEVTHLKLPHQGSKLNPKQYGPFKILKGVSPVTFKLDLPVSWTIHPVFHASLLTLYIKTKTHGPNYSQPPPDLINDKEQYEVEQIRNHQHHRHSRMLQYLIKWWGYPKSDNT